MTRKTRLSVGPLEKAINIPAPQWAGKCFGIAQAAVKSGHVQGAAVYGHWRGHVAPGTLFDTAGYRGLGICRHGWVLLPDGQVYDPTRWVFEDVEPYIYRGPADHYDEGGDQLRAAMAAVRPVPPFNPAGKTFPLDVPDPGGRLAEVMIRQLLKAPQDRRAVGFEEAFWLANLPYSTFTVSGMDVAPKIYEWFAVHGLSEMVPIDNRTRAARVRS